MVRVFQVGEVNQYLKGLFSIDPVLTDVWIDGEVSNLSRSAAGHTYWTLKDSTSQLRCVLFRREAQWQSVELQNGIAVLAHGRIDIYEAAGAYQLYVDLVEQQGQGLLYLQFEQLKRRLEAEGLFETDRKRPLPERPQRIGLVTSLSGAVLHDVMRVLARRYPLVELIVAPTPVQGRDAPEGIRRALELLNAQDDVDVIIVARGGGSLEDLWSFNDESVVRAVAESRIPVVSGVGHETDVTLCDLAADVRAATPSVAAELVTPSIDDDRALVSDLILAQVRIISEQLLETHEMLGDLRSSLNRRSPRSPIAEQRQRVDELRATLAAYTQARLQRARLELDDHTHQLLLVNPSSVLRRGYAIVRERESGAIVTSALQGTAGTQLRIRVQDGEFGAVATP
jgi:exodeoxyribonuclease VII large subunit